MLLRKAIQVGTLCSRLGHGRRCDDRKLECWIVDGEGGGPVLVKVLLLLRLGPESELVTRR